MNNAIGIIENEFPDAVRIPWEGSKCPNGFRHHGSDIPRKCIRYASRSKDTPENNIELNYEYLIHGLPIAINLNIRMECGIPSYMVLWPSLLWSTSGISIANQVRSLAAYSIFRTEMKKTGVDINTPVFTPFTEESLANCIQMIKRTVKMITDLPIIELLRMGVECKLEMINADPGYEDCRIALTTSDIKLDPLKYTTFVFRNTSVSNLIQEYAKMLLT